MNHEECPQLLTGSERLTGHTLDLSGDTVLDFWQWACSDLCDNTFRGVFAEWLVKKLLGDTTRVRVGWAVHDVTTPEGYRIEVKSSAYRQSWHIDGRDKESAIAFSRIMSRAWSAEAGYTDQQEHHADVYVFCVQTCRMRSEFDALDLSQWEFYVVPVAVMRRHGYRSIGLSALRKLAAPCRAEDLREVVNAACMAQIQADDSALAEECRY